ncbi:MAG: hypothetical protein K2Q22_10290, partial [Cytophagales bacterium]|nr:hypothetical protein [Cytophagales bacterium]
RSTSILIATIIILLGACVYLLSLEIEFFWGISTWWMRMAIWLRLFGVTAGLAICQQMVHAFLPNLKLPASIGLLIVLTILMFSKIHGTTTFDLPNAPQANNERDICQKIKNKLPRTAVLVHPFEFTGVQYYGRVSTYVTFKAIPKRDDYLKLWYNRIVEVYQVDTNRTEKGFDLVKPANENFSKLSTEDLKKLKNEGVTHLITFSWVNYPSFRKIASNKQYTVYEL